MSEHETAGERPAQASPEPLSEARLAEMKRYLADEYADEYAEQADAPWGGFASEGDYMLRQALAEVDRLRAELAAAQLAVQSERDLRLGYREETQAAIARSRTELARAERRQISTETLLAALEIVRAVASTALWHAESGSLTSISNDVRYQTTIYSAMNIVEQARALLAAVDGGKVASDDE